MISVLSKPVDQIGIHDIAALIESKVPEGEQIEFKESLSTKRHSIDPWISGNGQIGERAKKEILEESVAFANAYGGTLLLGIGESDTKPSVAAKISPVPRCAELVERLKLVFRDCVEPQLPQLEIFAVLTKGDDGVVIIRVGRSRLAPHRVTTTLVCPVRRADRCEKMTMREIQDMTLNVSRGLERLEKQLSARSARFQQEFKRLKTPEDAFGIRLTATPVGEAIRFERVFRENRIVEELDQSWYKVLYQPGSGETGARIGRDGYVLSVGESASERAVRDIFCENFPSLWRPMLRTARAEPDPSGTNLSLYSYREIHCDGLVELGFVAVRQIFVGGNGRLPPLFPLPMFANLAVWADCVRCHANTPAAEYALEVELCVKGGPVQIRGERGAGAVDLQPGSTPFPRYSLGSPHEFNTLLELFDRDFENFLGREIRDDQGLCIIDNWPEQGKPAT